MNKRKNIKKGLEIHKRNIKQAAQKQQINHLQLNLLNLCFDSHFGMHHTGQVNMYHCYIIKLLSDTY